MPRYLHILLLSIAGLGLLAVGYWNISPDSFNKPAAIGEQNQDIDYFVVGATSREFKEDGRQKYFMTATRLEHVQTTDITHVSVPHLKLYRSDESQPWLVDALKGEVSPGGKEVELIEQVKIDHLDAKQRRTQLQTSRLTVIPDKDYAETAQPVRIDAANGVTTATGMRAYLKEGRMQLLSNVRGQHEAP